MEPGNDAVDLDDAAPPDDGREPAKMLADLTGGCFLYAERHQRAGIPEGCGLARSPSSRSRGSASRA